MILSPDQDSRLHDDNGEECALTLGINDLIGPPHALFFFQEGGFFSPCFERIRNGVNYIWLIIV